ncbi:glycosyltransferase family 2 protein [Desulfosudis oleivorans]|uniref:Glycosyl transferase family 2 n=1 Tax=Desulfosudis oleivorans (strain DSM 6200 / JCM 39069 / Hxd3) TaxID=96561 RepID=A8ZT88_DESOH|nr:glycosyltransferase family 2 protein [Desulfosudis oleivorans]ABW67771.1 glycosyl transferase family 2 [Desulfosudis oleivorans Hxd3]
MIIEKIATTPKVSIGIPTYNRADLLRRSIESALGQDYPNIEVLVSDNASTDRTPEVCQFYTDTHGSRIKYIRQPVNLGATANFSKVLEMASGEFFMWLGDDDWIDSSYVKSCMRELLSDPALSLVSGSPRYYRSGVPACDGRWFNLLQERWWLRVLVYYIKVSDNGMFYGLMRTAQIRQINLSNTMGGDWLLIAGLSALGKLKTVPDTHAHRELGGATLSYRQIARSMGLSRMQAMFPMVSIAKAAWVDIVFKGAAYESRSIWGKLVIGSSVFGLILLKRPVFWILAMKFIIKKKLFPSV